MTKVKLKQMRPQDVPLDEVLDAMETSGKWVVKKLKGNPTTGPFSEQVLTERAAKFFPKLAYTKWASGEWKWKPGLSLTTQFIRIIRSEMSHRMRDWLKNQNPHTEESLSDEAVALEAAQALAGELQMEEELKDLGYRKAFVWLKDHPRLLTYVTLVRETNNYRTISKKMRITMEEVRELERETLVVIRAAKEAK